MLKMPSCRLWVSNGVQGTSLAEIHLFADAVVIPAMSFSGMEHWGLVTYNAHAVLFTPGFSTLYDMEGIALLVAHEIAHQVLQLL